MESKCHLFFETLGNKLKIGIITKLKEKPASVNELAKQLKQERSKISHALLTLLGCGFVEVKKEGKKRIYKLNKNTMMPLLSLVEKHVQKYCKTCKKMEGKKDGNNKKS
ncbi:winged helix-turn-helix transcriptional regulator [Candidatus Woesearchaeota archaeon]|nr:winged helix-turn-helix transcriptional regulator [Candidatus Woesearchaeota archaeon]